MKEGHHIKEINLKIHPIQSLASGRTNTLRTVVEPAAMNYKMLPVKYRVVVGLGLKILNRGVHPKIKIKIRESQLNWIISFDNSNIH